MLPAVICLLSPNTYWVDVIGAFKEIVISAGNTNNTSKSDSGVK